MELTCGERAVRCLLGEPTDRAPYGVGIGWFPWGQTLERWHAESGDPELDIARTFGFDVSFALPSLSSGISPAFEPKILEENENFIIHRDERGITMRNRRDCGSMPEFLDYPVKTPDDWERLKEERLRIDDPSRILQDWDAFRERIKTTGEAVQVGLSLIHI